MQTHKDIHTHTHTAPTVFDVPIIQKIYDFYILLYQYLKLFPRKDRPLGQKLDNLTLAVFEHVFMAAAAYEAQKLPCLAKAIVTADLLKILIRAAKDNYAIDNKKYLALEQNLQEIGRMLGGWKRSIK